MDVRMGSWSRWDGGIGKRSRSDIFGRVRGGIRNLNRVRNLDGYLDVLLAHILHSRMALFFVKGLLNQLVVSVTLLFLRRSTLFFWDVGVGHVAGLVDQGLAPIDDLCSVPRHCHRVAFNFHCLLTLFPGPRLEPSCLTFFQIV